MRLLFIRFSSIGDIVLTTPAIRCLKLQVPDAEVHFLTKQSMKAVTEANPYIDKFHYFSHNLDTLIKDLQAEQYDYIIDLHKNFRTWRIKKALKVPVLLTTDPPPSRRMPGTTDWIAKKAGRSLMAMRSS